MITRPAPWVVAIFLLATACSGGDSSTPAAQPEPHPDPSKSATEAPGLTMTCAGDGSPTVVLEAGLNTSSDTFAALAGQLSATTRVCYSDRAGVGTSAALADDAPDPWPGSSADALAAELERQGETGPYVVLGWSYGGMVAQAFAKRHPDLTAGLVLEDSSVRQQFVDPEWERFDVVDGGRPVDLDTTVAELSEVDLGDVPTVVLSSDELREAADAVVPLPRPVGRLLHRCRPPRGCRLAPRDPRDRPRGRAGRRRCRRRSGPYRRAPGILP